MSKRARSSHEENVTCVHGLRKRNCARKEEMKPEHVEEETVEQITAEVEAAEVEAAAEAIATEAIADAIADAISEAIAEVVADHLGEKEKKYIYCTIQVANNQTGFFQISPNARFSKVIRSYLSFVEAPDRVLVKELEERGKLRMTAVIQNIEKHLSTCGISMTTEIRDQNTWYHIRFKDYEDMDVLYRYCCLVEKLLGSTKWDE
jgi:hypothetical protein